jgi:uncharacterized protein YkwD
MPGTTRILVAFLAGSVAFGLASTASARGLSSAEASLLKTVNVARTSHSLAPVRIDARLERTARSHSADMLRRQYFAHGAFASRVRSSGVWGPVFGENLAWGPVSASWVVGRWLASPEHRSILLRPGFRRIGIGAYQGTFAGRSGALVVTADFAGR